MPISKETGNLVLYPGTALDSNKLPMPTFMLGLSQFIEIAATGEVRDNFDITCRGSYCPRVSTATRNAELRCL